MEFIGFFLAAISPLTKPTFDRFTLLSPSKNKNTDAKQTSNNNALPHRLSCLTLACNLPMVSAAGCTAVFFKPLLDVNGGVKAAICAVVWIVWQPLMSRSQGVSMLGKGITMKCHSPARPWIALLPLCLLNDMCIKAKASQSYGARTIPKSLPSRFLHTTRVHRPSIRCWWKCASLSVMSHTNPMLGLTSGFFFNFPSPCRWKALCWINFMVNAKWVHNYSHQWSHQQLWQHQ